MRAMPQIPFMAIMHVTDKEIKLRKKNEKNLLTPLGHKFIKITVG